MAFLQQRKRQVESLNAMSTQCLCSDASPSFFVDDVSPFLGITHGALQSPQTQNGIAVGVWL